MVISISITVCEWCLSVRTPKGHSQTVMGSQQFPGEAKDIKLHIDT